MKVQIWFVIYVILHVEIAKGMEHKILAGNVSQILI